MPDQTDPFPKGTSTPPQPLDAHFILAIEKDGSYPTYLTVPGSAELLGTGRPVKVTGTLDGHAFAATLMAFGPWPALAAAAGRPVQADRQGPSR